MQRWIEIRRMGTRKKNRGECVRDSALAQSGNPGFPSLGCCLWRRAWLPGIFYREVEHSVASWREGEPKSGFPSLLPALCCVICGTDLHNFFPGSEWGLYLWGLHRFWLVSLVRERVSHWKGLQSGKGQRGVRKVISQGKSSHRGDTVTRGPITEEIQSQGRSITEESQSLGASLEGVERGANSQTQVYLIHRFSSLLLHRIWQGVENDPSGSKVRLIRGERNLGGDKIQRNCSKKNKG